MTISVEVITPDRKAMEQGGVEDSRLLELVEYGEDPEPLGFGQDIIFTVSSAVVRETSIPEASLHTSPIVVFSYEAGRGGTISGEILPAGRWLIRGDLKFHSS